MKAIVPVLCCLFILACKQNEAKPPAAESRAAPPVPNTQPSAARAPAAQAAPEGPLNLDEARFQKWAAFRKELNGIVHKGMGENFQAHAGKKDETTTQAMADLHGMGKGLQAMATQIEAVRSKYGFTDAEDKRIWTAAMSVTAAKLSDNPMMASTMESMRKAAKENGPGKEGAEKFLKEQAEREAKQLAETRARFGDDAIAVLSAHNKELSQMQVESVSAAFGGRK